MTAPIALKQIGGTSTRIPFSDSTGHQTDSAKLTWTDGSNTLLLGTSGTSIINAGGGRLQLQSNATTVLDLGAASTDFVQFGAGTLAASGWLRFAATTNGTIQSLITIRSGASNVDLLNIDESAGVHFVKLNGSMSSGLLLDSGSTSNTLRLTAGGSGAPRIELLNTTMKFVSGLVTLQSVDTTASRAMMFNFATLTSDVAPGSWTMSAQSALSTASTNLNGGAIALKPGDAKTNGSSGLRGKCQLFLGQSQLMLEATEVTAGGRVWALGRGSAITTTEVPSGDLVGFIGNALTEPAIGDTSPSNGFLLWGSSGAPRVRGTGGALTTLAPAGAGTINSQAGTAPRHRQFGRVTATGGTVTLDVPVPSGTTISIVATAIARVVTASVATTGDSFKKNIEVTYRNVGGTVTQIGMDTSIVADADTSVSTSTFASSASSTNVRFTLTMNVATGTLSAGDVTIAADSLVN